MTEIDQTIHFSHSNWLWVIPVFLIILLTLLKTGHPYIRSLTQLLKNHNKRVYRHPFADVLKPQSQTKDTSEKLFPFSSFALYAIFTSLVFVALAQPYRLGAKLPEPKQYRDVVFIVDTSVNMVIRDYIVNGERTERMTMLKGVLNHFTNGLQGNRISIILFSETAYTYVPLTDDHELLTYQIQRIRPATLTGRSSDVSHALMYCLQKYSNEQTQSTDKPVFVLITDVNRPARDVDPRAVAKLMADSGYKIHTIAIGSASYDAEDASSQTLVYHPVNIQLLEQIAQNGNGNFYWAKDTQSLNDALDVIRDSEKRDVSEEPRYIRQPLYQWPLLASMLWLLLFMSYPMLSKRT